MASTSELVHPAALDQGARIATDPAATDEDRANAAADVTALLDRLTARRRVLNESERAYQIGLTEAEITSHRAVVKDVELSIYRARAILHALQAAR